MAERWIVDLSASLSITSNCEWLANYRKLSKLKKVWMGDERYIYAVGVGQVKITIHQKAIYLVQNVYYVSNFNGNLLLVSYLVNCKYYVYFLTSSFKTLDLLLKSTILMATSLLMVTKKMACLFLMVPLAFLKSMLILQSWAILS